MTVYEFYFRRHSDRANEEQCRFSDRMVPHNTDVVCWGSFDKATCPYCGSHVVVYSAPATWAVKGGAA